MWKNTSCRESTPSRCDGFKLEHESHTRLPVVRALRSLGICPSVRPRGCASGGAAGSYHVSQPRLDHGRHDRGPKCGLGLQSPCRRAARRLEPTNRQTRTAPRRDEQPRGDHLCRRHFSRVHLRHVAPEWNLFCVIAGRSGYRVLVFACETLHALDPAVPGPGHGRRASRWMARRWRSRRLGALAAGACDWHVGRRVRRLVRMPGSRVRPGSWSPPHSGPLRGVCGLEDLSSDACDHNRFADGASSRDAAPVVLSPGRVRRRGDARLRTIARPSGQPVAGETRLRFERVCGHPVLADPRRVYLWRLIRAIPWPLPSLEQAAPFTRCVRLRRCCRSTYTSSLSSPSTVVVCSRTSSVTKPRLRISSRICPPGTDRMRGWVR